MCETARLRRGLGKGRIGYVRREDGEEEGRKEKKKARVGRCEGKGVGSGEVGKGDSFIL